MEDRKYLGCLFASFGIANALDFALKSMKFDRDVSQIVSWVFLGICMAILIYVRAKYLNRNPVWAASAIIPALGFLVGLYLYFQDSREAE